MKKVEITGSAKIKAYRSGNYSSLEINGLELEALLVDKMIEKDEKADGYQNETSICRVSITIEPYTATLSVNGQEMALEL